MNLRKIFCYGLTAVLFAALSGCFNPWKGDEGTITVNFGAAGNRALTNETAKTYFVHEIRLFGPGGEQIFESKKGALSARFSVAPGRYEITVKAFITNEADLEAAGIVEYETEGERYLAARGSAVVNVIAGQNNPVEITMSSSIERMVWVAGGSFQMGTANGGNSDERPVRMVTLTGFYMGRTEVTQAQYQEVMGENPSQHNGYDDSPSRPVENVSWYDALVYCNRLSMLEGLSPAYSISGSADPAVWGSVPASSNAAWNAVTIVDGSAGYRLPTEAQWEYAAKGGDGSPGNYTFAGSNDPDEVAWYGGNNDPDGTKPAAAKAPNGLGLYDMSGNVAEWCWDRYGTYPGEAQTDPEGPSSGSSRVERCGNYYLSDSTYLRSAARYGSDPGRRFYAIGFRVARPAGGGGTSGLEYTLIGEGAAYSVKKAAGAALTGALVIPASYNGLPVTEIGQQAFNNCTGLTSVIIPASVKTIGLSAFAGGNYDPMALATVTFAPNSQLETIGRLAFNYCTVLTGVTIPGSVTYIDSAAFQNCNGLTSVTIPDSVGSINDYAFNRCAALADVTIGSGVGAINEYAFTNCPYLITVTFKSGSTIIADNAFAQGTVGGAGNDLRTAYRGAAGGGAGTYKRTWGGNDWAKQ